MVSSYVAFAHSHDRDENTKRPLPRRLQELVAQYPYTNNSSDQTPDGLLTRPRFSTRRYDALFVRVEAVYPDAVHIPSSRSPVGVFADALESEPKSVSGGHLDLWNQVKAAASYGSDDKPLLAILSDDTINLLSFLSTDPKEQALLGIPGAASALVSPLSPITKTTLSPTANGNGTSTPVHRPTDPPSPPQSPKNWAEFSSAGFGETTLSQDFASTLLDKDLEVTEPPIERKPSKRKQDKITVAPVEPNPPASDPKPAPEEPKGPKLILVATEVVQLDEAFIDFWRDAVVDPISSDWPQFVVGELKHPLTPRSASTSSEGGDKAIPGSPINWIIIEEKLRRITPPPTPAIPNESLTASGGLKAPAPTLRRTSSPRPSFGEKKNSLSATLKRFTLFGSSKDDLATEDTTPAASGSGKKDSFGGRKKHGVGKSPKIGEMGEAVLSEEPEVPQEADEPGKVEKVEEKREVVAVAAGAVGGALLVTTAGSDGGPTKEDAVTRVDEPVVPHQDDPSSEVEAEPDTLPPAPKSVISHGETPGPQLALDSTEAGLHHALDVEEPQEPPTQLATPPSEPVVEHLEDQVEESAADVGVELDPVPIISNDPVHVQEVEEPEVVEEPMAEGFSVTEVPSAQTPAIVSEQELEPAPAHLIIEEAVEESQPAITEGDIVANDVPTAQSTVDG